ncbi:MAG: T9SS type A sorting domain-containing protein [bacterium]
MRLGLRLERNPVTDRALLSYELPHGGPVSCTVRDAAGREVARLLDATQAAGRHTVAWDAADAAPGVYFLELATGGTASAARLVKGR